MLGAIAGDIIGSVFEGAPIKHRHFPLFVPSSRFTDDTVLTVAVAQALLTDGDYARAIKTFGRRYPDAGYGGLFVRWLFSEQSGGYHSWGNGAAMRVSPVGFALSTESEVLAEARRQAMVTHDHPEGIRGAQAVALAIFLARRGLPAPQLRQELEQRFGYTLSRTLAEIRPHYAFDVSARGSVPEALCAFLESRSYEDAVRGAVSLGGDSDTQACMAGAIAEAAYGLPPDIATRTRRRLPTEFLDVIDDFYQTWNLIRSWGDNHG